MNNLNEPIFPLLKRWGQPERGSVKLLGGELKRENSLALIQSAYSLRSQAALKNVGIEVFGIAIY